MNLIERFWSKVECGTDDECWEWVSHKNYEGYGQFKLNGCAKRAHRVAYELEIGSIPEGKDIHHRCENKGCINPWHLQAVTPKEHNEIGENKYYHQNSRKTHCPRGHEYTEENTGINNGSRYCKTCDREKHRKEYEIAFVTNSEAKI